MKKLLTVFSVLMVVAFNASTLQARPGKMTKKEIAALAEKAREQEEYKKTLEQAEFKNGLTLGEKRGYTNQLDSFVVKDSAQFYSGCDIHLSPNGDQVYYDSVGAIVQTDYRITIKAGQMGLYIKTRQHSEMMNGRKAVWITYLAEDSGSYVDVPYTAPNNEYNQVFQLSGEEIKFDGSIYQNSFITVKPEFSQIVRGLRATLLVFMKVDSKESPARDFKIHQATAYGKPSGGPTCPAVAPGLKLVKN